MMTFRSKAVCAAGALATALIMAAAPASALGLKDCSDKYSAAKAAGKVGNKTFADYQKSDCGPDAKPLPAPAAKPAAAAPAAKPAAPAAKPVATPPAAAAATTPPAAATTPAPAKQTKAEKRRAERAAKAKPATGPVTGPVFPTAIADSYKSRKPSKARLATCLDQYKTNKATNANGGLRWIQKGGGFYSQCNKKLKA